MSAETTPTGIIFDAGTLSFVLIGPSDSHRRVLVRSPDATLDLIGLDGLPDGTIGRENVGSWFMMTFGRHRQRNIVRGSESVPVGVKDTRTSHYSFAWRGLASRGDREEVRDLLTRISPDLEYALSTNRIDDLEFTLSPLILLCQERNESISRSVMINRSLLALAAIAYGAIAVVAQFIAR